MLNKRFIYYCDNKICQEKIVDVSAPLTKPSLGKEQYLRFVTVCDSHVIFRREGKPVISGTRLTEKRSFIPGVDPRIIQYRQTNNFDSL